MKEWQKWGIKNPDLIMQDVRKVMASSEGYPNLTIGFNVKEQEVEVRERLRKYRKALEDAGIDAAILSNYHSIFYLTGYYPGWYDRPGSEQYALITREERDPVITMVSYNYLGAISMLPYFRLESIRPHNGKPAEVIIKEAVDELGLGDKTIGVEEDDLNLAAYNKFKKLLPKAKFVYASRLLWRIRAIKTPLEIRLLRRSCEIADIGMDAGMKALAPGVTEAEVAGEIYRAMLKAGAWDHWGHPLLIKAGQQITYAEEKVTDYRIRRGEPICLDLGANYRGYISDITRTAVIGEPPRWLTKIFKITYEMNKKVIEAIKPGVTGDELYKISERVFLKSGWSRIDPSQKLFMEPQVQENTCYVGHSIGLVCHETTEAAFIQQGNKKPLEAGMVMAVEPLIMQVGLGAARLENVVLVTEDGCEVLTKYPWDLNVINR
ncbi:MAG: Xaa-Pro peptidase family protein [Nitrososphaerales archaeon]